MAQQDGCWVVAGQLGRSGAAAQQVSQLDCGARLCGRHGARQQGERAVRQGLGSVIGDAQVDQVGEHARWRVGCRVGSVLMEAVGQRVGHEELAARHAAVSR